MIVFAEKARKNQRETKCRIPRRIDTDHGLSSLAPPVHSTLAQEDSSSRFSRLDTLRFTNPSSSALARLERREAASG